MDFTVDTNAWDKSSKGQEENIQVGTANINVIGAGGAGSNMVSWLYKKGIKGAKVIACNTDVQHLNIVHADQKFLIGRNVTRGLGCGGFPQKGAEAAKETISEIKSALKGSDMVFICAGMGGGTGTGAAPVIGQIAKESGSIVIGTVTMPFDIERARKDRAEHGLLQLREVCDTVVVIDNNRLVKIVGNLPVEQAFAVANEIISTMIRGIVETIALPSLVNLDFADVKAIMTNGGLAAIGIGTSNTNNRIQEAVQGALSNPLLEIDYKGASGALIHIEGGPDLTLEEVSRMGDLITKNMDEDANVIWGARISDSMKGRVCIMTVMTGVTSPYITGRVESKSARKLMSRPLQEEIGIEFL